MHFVGCACDCKNLCGATYLFPGNPQLRKGSAPSPGGLREPSDVVCSIPGIQCTWRFNRKKSIVQVLQYFSYIIMLRVSEYCYKHHPKPSSLKEQKFTIMWETRRLVLLGYVKVSAELRFLWRLFPCFSYSRGCPLPLLKILSSFPSNLSCCCHISFSNLDFLASFL